MSNKSKLMLLTLGAVAALMAMPVNAGAIRCSDFADGVITEGTYDYNIIVDIDCYVDRFAIVNGNISEPRNTVWSISVDPEGTVNGNIEEKGPGFVFVDVGHNQRYIGNISEKGDGYLQVWVDGVFHGSVVEQGEGDVIIEVFDGCPSSGPGIFVGSTMEKGRGDAYLSVREGECSTEDGYYEGDFTEKGPGSCFINGGTPSELPTVNFNCATLEVGWPDP